MPSKTMTRGAVALLAAFGVVGSGACSYVGQDDLDIGLADLRAEMRQEMQQGDSAVVGAVGARVDALASRLDRLEQDLNTLESEFGVTVERLETALRFNVPVYFGFDEAALSPDARVVLQRFSEVADEYYPQALITVEGFTDAAGSAEYNRLLGQRRADAVRSYLVGDGGLTGDLVRAVSYGEQTARLVTPGQTGPGSEGWQNRRVVMVIEHNGAGPARIVTDQPGIS